MTRTALVYRSLRHYWRSHVAVVAGVATAVAVLAGALLVGDSVRGSLRDLVLRRIGHADNVVVSTGFFREALAGEIGGTPLVVMQGAVSEQASGRQVSRVEVYGVDDRFWSFHGISGMSGPSGDGAYLSQALAGECARGVRSARPRAARPGSGVAGKYDSGGGGRWRTRRRHA
jgi:hypothetical protein